MGRETTEISNGGLTQHWVERGKVLVYTFYDNRRTTIDSWVEAVLLRLQNTDPHQPNYILYNISRIFISPYMRERVDVIGKVKPHTRKNYFAIILLQSISGEMIKKYLSQDFEEPFALELQFFHDFPSAVIWLRAKLTKEES